MKKINKKDINKLKKFIHYFVKNTTKLESTSTPFNMWDTWYSCGTPMCLYGWLRQFDRSLTNELCNFLGRDCDFMFGYHWADYPECNTIQQAVKRLIYVIKYGKVPAGWKYGDTY